MWGVCKPLMDEQLSIAASTIEDLKLFSFLYIVGGITLTGAGIYVKVGSHLCEGVVAHVPEGYKGHGGLLAVLERNVILTRHYRRYCPHKLVIVEPYCIKGEADVSMHLEGGEEGRRGVERKEVKCISHHFLRPYVQIGYDVNLYLLEPHTRYMLHTLISL